MVVDSRVDVLGGVHRKTGGVKGLSNELMQLRKIGQHPFMFDSVEDKINPGCIIDDKIIRSSGKIELLNRILPKFFDQGHRVRLPFPPFPSFLHHQSNHNQPTHFIHLLSYRSSSSSK